MNMKIGMTSALKISNQMVKTSDSIARSMERLSSGSRANDPRDYASMLSELSKLDAKVRGTNQATLNLNSASGEMQTASAAIDSQIDIVQRMREIGLQASNGTLSTSDQSNLNMELQGLFAEFSRITSETDFNGQKLLDGTYGSQTLQVGADRNNQYQIAIANLSASSVFTKLIGTGKFNPATTTQTGAGSTYVVTGDFNGDGVTDFATSDATSNTITVNESNGDGTFTSKTAASLSFTPGRLAKGDFNGDGSEDLVVTDTAGNASILLANGNGTFKTGATFSLGGAAAAADSIAVGDLIGSGVKDIVSVDNSSTISVLLGNGDGTFRTATTFSNSANGATSVALADINGDGKLDLITSGNTGVISIYAGNGDGTFATAVTYSADTSSTSVTAADLNGDGKLDLISSNPSSGKISVLLNNGNGTFGSAAQYSGVYSSKIKTTDVNGDGVADLITTSGVMLGNGDGTFKALQTFTGSPGSDFALGDFQNHGAKDIVQVNSGASASVYQNRTLSVNAVPYSNTLTADNAKAFVAIADTALNNLRADQASIGAFQSRLDVTTNFNSSMNENYQQAKTNLGSIDIAQEIAELTRTQILQQAQVAAFSQANVAAEQVLQLLKFNN